MHQLTVVIGALVALARAEEGSAASYTAPAAGANVLLLETFQDDWASRWVASKKEVYSGKFETQPYALDALAGDVGLVMAHKAHRYGLSRKLAAPVEASTQPLVVQYEVSLKNGLECGGAYLKLLNVDASFDGDAFEEPTPYSIMFGPDKCANAGKVHFIFKFKNPTTGEWVEHHLKDGPRMPPSADRVVQTHLYKFVLLPESKLTIQIDDAEPASYSLLTDFEPAVNPPALIDDPTETKPADWVDARMVADPAATKPEDWDEDAPYMIADPKVTKPEGWHDDAPERIADPSASRPADWDTDEDGEWEAPLVANPLCSKPGCGTWTPPQIENPAFKGKWHAPMIDNPAYKGEFTPKQIANPVWFEDLNPGASLAPIGAVGFELWTMDDGVLFDNVLIGRSEAEAAAFAASTWAVRHAAEVAAKAAKDKADAEAAAGSLKDRASSYVQQAVMLAVTKPVPTGIALFVTLALLITSCLLPRGAGKKKDAAAAAAKPAAAPADKATANKAARGSGDKASGDEEDEAAETSAAKPAAAAKRAPRRTPKASD